MTESFLTNFTERMHPSVWVSDVAALVRQLVTVIVVFTLLAQPSKEWINIHPYIGPCTKNLFINVNAGRNILPDLTFMTYFSIGCNRVPIASTLIFVNGTLRTLKKSGEGGGDRGTETAWISLT